MALDPNKLGQWQTLAEAARGLDDTSIPLDVRQRSALAVAVVAREAVPALLDEVERRAAWILRVLRHLPQCPECSAQRNPDRGFYHLAQCPLAKFLASMGEQ